MVNQQGQFGVFQDANSRTCIRVQIGRVWTRFIPMESSGLRVQKLDNGSFARRYCRALSTPLDRACTQYLSARHISITEAARYILDQLITYERKRQMANVKFHLITAKGTHAGIATGEDELNAKLAELGEGSKGVRVPAELATLQLTSLTTLYNQFSAKAIKKLSDKSEKTIARLWALLPLLEEAVVLPEPPVVSEAETDKTEETQMATTKPSKRKPKADRPSKAERHTRAPRNGADGPREGTKAEKVYKALLKAGATGVTLEQLMKASSFDAANAKAQIANMRAGKVAGKKYDVSFDKDRGRYVMRA